MINYQTNICYLIALMFDVPMYELMSLLFIFIIFSFSVVTRDLQYSLFMLLILCCFIFYVKVMIGRGTGS